MKEKLFDSEAKIMEIIWEKSPITAKEISLIAAETIGWNKNTTYTVIKKCVEKGVIAREEPGFVCRPLITQAEVRRQETDALIDRLFEGSKELFFASLTDGRLTEREADELMQLVKKLR